MDVGAEAALPAETFRDPAGSLRLEEGRAVRTVRDDSRASTLEFLASPFCKRVQASGDLVAAAVEDSPEGLRLIHPRVAFPTYPWEWTPGQWGAAAELTLRLGEEALADGWILKDATPHNILFAGPRPVLVDILSFERRDPGRSVWLAYAQYVRTFLLPLVMHRLLGWPLRLSLFQRDGLEPRELYRVLKWRHRLSRLAFWPITLPAWLEARQGSAEVKQRGAGKDPGLALHVLRRTFRDLGARTRRALPARAASEWSEYSRALMHYSAEDLAGKNRWLRETLEELRPRRVLDVGANTGEYSALAAETGAEVVALERDGAAAERMFQRSAEQKLNILTIHADLARPSPAVGWENGESMALLPRLEGRFDLVLMLAVIHHLLLLEQIPLDAIVGLLHRLTIRYAVIEWVPASDPMYRSLVRGREMLYGTTCEADVMRCCGGRFTLRKRLRLGNGRVLLLLERT